MRLNSVRSEAFVMMHITAMRFDRRAAARFLAGVAFLAAIAVRQRRSGVQDART